MFRINGIVLSFCYWLKGTQAWDNLNFFYLKPNFIWHWLIFEKKNWFFFLEFLQEFRCSNISAVTEQWAYAEPNLFGELNFFLKMFTFVLLDGFLDGFSTFRLIIVQICILIWYFWVNFQNCSMRMLIAELTRKQFHCTMSLRQTNFCACSASGKILTVFTCSSMLSIWETFSSHPEHTRKCLKAEYLSRIEYDFQKSRVVTGPWNHKVSVSAKKKKNSCLCTFLSYNASFCTWSHMRWGKKA